MSITHLCWLSTKNLAGGGWMAAQWCPRDLPVFSRQPPSSADHHPQFLAMETWPLYFPLSPLCSVERGESPSRTANRLSLQCTSEAFACTLKPINCVGWRPLSSPLNVEETPASQREIQPPCFHSQKLRLVMGEKANFLGKSRLLACMIMPHFCC